MQVIPLKRSELRGKIESQNGRFFTVYFEKADKSFRQMNGRTGVRKYANGGKNPADGKSHLVNMLDRKLLNYRNANLNTVKLLRCEKKEFVIVD
jgi:hypothetical protein